MASLYQGGRLTLLTLTRNANNYIYYQLQQDSLFGPHATSPDRLQYTDYRVNQTFQMVSILVLLRSDPLETIDNPVIWLVITLYYCHYQQVTFCPSSYHDDIDN